MVFLSAFLCYPVGMPYRDPERRRAYMREYKRRHGVKPRRSEEDRCWSYVTRLAPDECWLWKGIQSRDGYGRFRIADGPYHRRRIQAHRWAYERLIGRIPTGLCIDHLCRTRLCVNPGHMEPVTIRQNIRRGGNANKRQCLRGHAFNATNTYITPDGRRMCRACARHRLSLRSRHSYLHVYGGRVCVVPDLSDLMSRQHFVSACL